MLRFATECPGLRDLAIISAQYAELTGVLAGFAFTAIVILLTPGGVGMAVDRRGPRTDVLLTFLVAFIALVIVTLSYSFLSGDPAPQARTRTATVELLTGVPFGLAVMMLFHGIALLLRAGDIGAHAVWTARVMAVVVAPGMTLYYVSAGAADLEAVRIATATRQCVTIGPSRLGVVLTGTVTVLLAMSLIPAVLRLLWRWSHHVRIHVPHVVFAVVVATAVATRGLSTQPPDFIVSAGVVDAYLLITSLLFTLIGPLLAISEDRSVPVSSGQPDAGPN